MTTDKPITDQLATASRTMPQTKLLGAAHEVAFALECLERGAVVSQPFGDNSSYDLIVDVEGQLHRVQCKRGTLEKPEDKSQGTKEVWSVNSKKPSSNAAYSAGEVDFIVSLCGACWYIWKVADYQKQDKEGVAKAFPKSIKTYPTVADSEKYDWEVGRNNWGLLGLPDQRLTTNPAQPDTEDGEG